MRLARVCVVSVFALGVIAVHGESASIPVDFQREIRPILSDNCFQCHGPDASTRLANLRLDVREGAFGHRDNGIPIVPGDPNASLIIKRLTHPQEALRMPPVHSRKSLTEEQINTIRNWITQGADWSEHWAFRTPTEPTLPAVEKESWARNPVDRFVLARLEARGFSPAPEADKWTLARRVALDLTGLPPEPEIVEQFVQDKSDNAYDNLIEHYLSSEAYGEHRARYWLDAARYGDTHGMHVDNYREMWPYRDWVIKAYNRNLPFDQFTVDQIAGDMLPDPTLDQLIATGFHRCNATTNEAGLITEEYAAIYAKDRVDTTGTVFLGLTVGCATCHDHKFDPILQKDFYSMAAFFRNTTQHIVDGNVADTPPVVIVPSDQDRDQWYNLRAEAASIDAHTKEMLGSSQEHFDQWLETREYRSIQSPIDKESELLTMSLEAKAEVTVGDETQDIALHDGATIGDGPSPNVKGIRFPGESWAEIPSIDIDSDKPFSISFWVDHPPEEASYGLGNYLLSQSDPADINRGWKAVSQGGRQAKFIMTGSRPSNGASGQKNPSVMVGVKHSIRLPTGWTHLTYTHDGSGERAGLRVYRNGKIVPEQGSEYFTKIKGSIRSDQPIVMGRAIFESRGEIKTTYFTDGGIADFRVFNRPITAQEAKVVALWPTLEIARSKSISDLNGEERDALLDYYLAVKDQQYRALMTRRQDIDLEWREVRRRGAVTHVMQEIADKEPEAHILYRGMYDQPREKVKAATPGFLPPIPQGFSRNRMGLAQWMVNDSNPLTSRVIVNRYWQEVFGTGIVKTSGDFGAQGEPPSHPELLDWLAVNYRESGWDTKDFFRLLLHSATYRQSAETTEEKIEADPENRLLAHGPRFRMPAEMIRDYALSASGLLAQKIGGPSVKPYQPKGVWSSVAMVISNTRNYKQDSGNKLYRRSLYTFWKRAAPPASMDIFNAPSREHTVVRRERTNTPLQALVTMNDPQFVEAARHLAQTGMQKADEGFDSRLDFIAMRLLARPLDQKERRIARKTYESFVSFYGTNLDKAQQLLDTGASHPDRSLPEVESAALTMVASQIMNLDEVLNK
jgi:hypothetical protein